MSSTGFATEVDASTSLSLLTEDASAMILSSSAFAIDASAVGTGCSPDALVFFTRRTPLKLFKVMVALSFCKLEMVSTFCFASAPVLPWLSEFGVKQNVTAPNVRVKVVVPCESTMLCFVCEWCTGTMATDVSSQRSLGRKERRDFPTDLLVTNCSFFHLSARFVSVS